MGIVVSVAVANLYMEDLEDKSMDIDPPGDEAQDVEKVH